MKRIHDQDGLTNLKLPAFEILYLKNPRLTNKLQYVSMNICIFTKDNN